MTNCPNCGAPLNPYVWRCEYCKTYVWDTSSMDFEDEHPCFVKMKTPQGTVTMLAKPKLETVNVSDESVTYVDPLGNTLMSFTTNRQCNVNISFQCVPGAKNELFNITREEKDNG